MIQCFAGDRRWLEISVRPGASSGGYTNLLPRQELTVVPYALHTETVAAGAVGSAEVDQTQVQLRVVSSCPAGSSIRVIGQNGAVTCQAGSDAGGDITAVIAGAGLTGGATIGDATLNVDATQIQSRINSSCPAGQSVRSVDAAGNVVCEADDDTTYSAGTGIILNSTIFSVDPSAVQARVTGTCPPGSYMQAIDADGLVSCFDDEIGGGNVIIVAKSGGHFTSVTAAMNAIGVDPDYPASSSSNRYLVRVAPGEYENEDIDMQPYVDIEGSGQGVTVLRSVGGSGGISPDSATLVGADNAELRHVTVEIQAADPGNWTHAIYTAKKTSFRNVTAVSTGGSRTRGMLVNSGGDVTMKDVTLVANGATVSNLGLDLFSAVAFADGLFAEASGGDVARGVYLNSATSEVMLENITTHASGGNQTTGLRTDLSSVTLKGLRSIAIGSGGGVVGIWFNDPGHTMQVLGATIFAENTASGTTYGLFGSNANLELRDAVVNAVASSGAAVGASHWHNDVGQSANITIADVELRAESSAGAAFGLDIANSGATPEGTYGRVTELNVRATGGGESVNTYGIRHRAFGEVQYRGLSLVVGGSANFIYGIQTTDYGTPRFDDVVIDAVGEAETTVYGVEFQTDSTTLTNARVKALNFDTGTNHDAVGVKALNASGVAFTDVTTYAEAESWVWGADLVGSDTRLVRVDTRAVSTVSGFAYGVRCWGESSTIHDSLFRGDSAASSSFGIHVTDCDSELTGSEFIAAGSSTNIGLWGESTSGQSNTIEVRDSLLSGSTNSVRSLGAGAVSVEVVMSQLDGGAGFSASATDAQTCTAVTHNSAGSEMFQSGTSDPCP